jgi:hypothetical protein
MNTEKIVVLSCLLSLMGLSARAQEIKWNGDAMQQFKAALAGQTAAAPVLEPRFVVPQNTPAAPSARLEGKALGSDVLSRARDAFNDKVELNLNNDKDRVGATYSNCNSNLGEDIQDCDFVNFVFPQLTVDRQAKVIKLGDEVVAKLGSFWKGIGLVNGWHYVVSKNQETVDDGFNRRRITHVSVTLTQ